MALIQFQYIVDTFHGGVQFSWRNLPTRADLNRWRAMWIAGTPLPPGIKVKAIDWDGGRPVTWLRANKFSPGAPGVIARYTNSMETFCDYDTARIPEPGCFPNIAAVARCLGLKVRWAEYRRTRRGWHVTVRWSRKFSPAEIVALQAILGSDPVREMFNLTRVLSGRAAKDRRWNLLFERKI